jgi:peptidylprolyl isomerase
MDRRIAILIGFAAALAIAVVVIVIGNGDDGDSSKTFSFEKPTITVPDGDPPAELVKTDIKEGEGDPVETGDTVSVQYVGVDFDTGEEFDSSYNSGQPFTVTLGQGSVIKGWDEGIVGMKPGGERQLVIPPDLAYGPQGQPPKIKPNATLVFDIQLESAN